MKLQPTEFAKDFLVYRHDGDCYGDIKAGAVLRYGQQIATEHSTAIGLDDELYARTHTAYVLAKQALHFGRMPKVDEELTFVTQPERMKHAVNKRITRILDKTGAEVACMDARWVLIDTERRIILRTHPVEFTVWNADVERELPMRMLKGKPEDLVSMGERTAVYSQCDMNGHMNNTCYADVVCDVLPWEVWQKFRVSDMMIFYHKEIPKGESFEIKCLQTGEQEWYFAGLREGKNCFEASLKLCLRDE